MKKSSEAVRAIAGALTRQQRDDLAALGLQPAAVDDLAEACASMCAKLASMDTARRAKGANARDRAARFRRINAAAGELEKLLTSHWPASRDFEQLHETTGRLWRAENSRSELGFPESWGDALDALRYWKRAAAELQTVVEAERRKGPPPPPEYRADFIEVLAMIASDAGIGTRSAAGRFERLCSVCYEATRMPGAHESDLKTFIKRNTAKRAARSLR